MTPPADSDFSSSSASTGTELPVSPSSMGGIGASPSADHERDEQDLKKRVGDKVEETKTAAAESVEQAKAKVVEVGKQANAAVKEGAADVADNVRQLTRNTVAEQSDRLGEKAGEYARAARSAAEKLREQNDDVLAEKVEKVADTLSKSANYLKQSDASVIRQDAERLLRTNPEIAIGGLFLVGMAIGRFLKASPPGSDRDASIKGRATRGSVPVTEPSPFATPQASVEAPARTPVV